MNEVRDDCEKVASSGLSASCCWMKVGGEDRETV